MYWLPESRENIIAQWSLIENICQSGNIDYIAVLHEVRLSTLKESKMESCSSVKEIITFQVGNYSNFVGTHYWNLQEALLENGAIENNTKRELNHDILFRKGFNFQTGKHTCRPRVIAFDLQENVTNFALTDTSLGDDVDETVVWDGTVEKYDRGVENPKKPADAQISSTSSPIDGGSDTTNACNEHTTATWSDFSRSQFHNKSLQCIESLHSEACGSFDNFGSGEALFKSPKFCDEFEDRLHFFAEECDMLQGFQIFTDIHNGFGGVTSRMLLDLADDYVKKSLLCFATMPATFEDDTRHMLDLGMLNILLSFGKYVDASCQVVPLSLRDSYGLKGSMVEFPFVDYKGSSDYHTSAVVASAIDTATIPYRFTDNQSSNINTLVSNLSICGRKISAISLGLPIPVNSTLSLNDLLKGPMDYIIPLTPDVGQPQNILTQASVIRGIPTHLLKTESYQSMEKRISTLFQYQSSLGNTCPTYIAQTPCKVTQPFPDIFKPSVTQVGCVIESYERPVGVKVEKTSVMASLINCEDVVKPLEMLLQGTNKVNVMKYPGLLESGFEQADLESCREDIKVLTQNYQFQYSL